MRTSYKTVLLWVGSAIAVAIVNTFFEAYYGFLSTPPYLIDKIGWGVVGAMMGMGILLAFIYHKSGD